MEQFGVVLQVSDKTAKVSTRQHSACASCGKCNLAHESKDLVITALNQAGAVVGDRVMLEMAQREIFSAGFIVYTIPLIGLFLGAFLGQMLFGEAAAVILGFAGLLVTYLVIHWQLEPRFKASKRFNIVITQVLSDKEVTDPHGTQH